MLAHIIEIRQVASDVPLMGASVICANYFEKLFSFFICTMICSALLKKLTPTISLMTVKDLSKISYAERLHLPLDVGCTLHFACLDS